ncbi:enolase C-terminal domain-like protein [Bradyrhizobium sp. USDA 3256]
MTLPLTIQSVKTRAVKVPLRFTLGTSAAVVRAVPLLLIDLEMQEGVTGRCYLFCYTTSGALAVAGHIAEAVELTRERASSPLALGQSLERRFALLGVSGTARMALSAIDIAAWDALGVALQQPLARLLGSEPSAIPAYDSRGLGLMRPSKLADEAKQLLSSGLRAIKLRLGYPTLSEDVEAIRAVRRAVPDGIDIMVDYNQALVPTEAILRGRALEGEGLLWIEEPIRHDDLQGNALIAQELALPLQLGENFNGPPAMMAALAADACDYVMPDVARIGGVTGWTQAAGIAAARGIAMSSHLMPEISVHLLAATPTMHWLEYVDWADAILLEPMKLSDGSAECPTRPGLGISWDEGKLKHLETL